MTKTPAAPVGAEHLLRNASQVMAMVDPDGRIAYVSASVEEMLGYRPEELVGQPAAILVDPEEQPEVAEAVARRLRDATGGARLLAARHRDGTPRVLAGRTTPVVGADGSTRLVVVVQDVTDRAEVEARLHETEERLRSLFDHHPDAVFTLDPQGRFQAVNDAAVALSGYTREELVGSDIDRVVHQDDRPTARAHLASTLTGRTARWDLTILRSDGVAVPLRVAALPVMVQGRVVGVHGVAQDLTARVAAQRALEESEKRLRLTLEQLPALVWTLDEELLVTWVAGNALGQLPFSASDLIGHPISVWTGDDPDHDVLLRHRRALAGAREAWEAERPDGSVFQAYLQPLVSPDGGIRGVIGIALDVTAERHAQRELRDRERELLHAQKLEAVGRLAGGVAHDFNNILTAITGYAEMIGGSLSQGHPLRDDALQIIRAAHTAADLTRQLLVFSRKDMPSTGSVELNERLEWVERFARRLLPEEIELRMEAEEGLWTVAADASGLDQVVMNLVVNAREAIDGSGRITLTASNRSGGLEDADVVALTVEDSGAGMSEEVLDRIFEPFFTTKAEGTGLGLPTVRGIVERWGGSLRVTSRPGHGTRFEILLPREGSIASPSAGASSEETRASLGNATLREATIILAEDQEMVRRMVEGALTRAGARVVSAGSAEAALALAEREGRPDLVLTDIGLPGMGGRQLGERMSALYPGVPLVFMSAYTEDTVLQRGVRARDVRFLQKPFSPSSLLEALSRALSDDGDASAHPPQQQRTL